MFLPLVVLCLPLAVWSIPCQSKVRNVLTCQNIALKELPKYYNGETLIHLDNVTGDESIEVDNLTAVNSIVGSNLNLTEGALKRLLSLQHLSTLELRDSNIEITDGSSIFTGPNLRYLRFINSLKKPVEFFNFTLLQEFDLSGNKLMTIPKIHGEKLAFLNVSSTGIRTVDNLENLPYLEELDLSFNGLRNVDANAFTSNEDLTKLWLQNNNLKEVKFNASKLTILNLNYNDMGVVKGEYFVGVPQVTNLFLVGNLIMEMVEPFKNLTHLKVLDLSDNDLTVFDATWFEHTPELEVLRMSHNDLLELPGLTQQLHSLHYLNLSHNSLQTLNSNFFKQTPALATLDVTHNQLKFLDAGTTHLRELNKLYAAHNFLTITPDTFAKSEMLNYANLSHNKLTIGPQVFSKALALRDIDLSYNDIAEFCDDGKFPAHIQNLDISFNKLISIKCLTSLPSGYLTSLDVEGNPLICDVDLTRSMPKAPRTNTPADVAQSLAHEEESDEGDWKAVYGKLCPTGRTTPAVTSSPQIVLLKSTPEFSIMHDITEKQVSSTPGSSTVMLDDSEEDSEEDDDDDDDYDDGDVDQKNMVDQSAKHVMYEPLATWAFALLGVCLILLLINLLMFVWYKRREREEARLGSDRPYQQLHNEIYKNTTTGLEGIHRPFVDVRKYFKTLKNEKLSEIIVKMGRRSQGDAESQARMIPTEPTV